MTKYGGIVDSYAYYRPSGGTGTAMPPIPTFDAVLPNEDVWCAVDEKVDDDPYEWSPSVCTSDDVEAADEVVAASLLLDRHRYDWPEKVGGWELSRVRHEVVMDGEPGIH